MIVTINPGTGPLPEATEAHAIENIKHYVTDCGVPRVDWVRIPAYDYGGGRYAFLVWRQNVCHEVQMPGLPLHEVRYVASGGQSPFDYPRLYVDGSSWLWAFALLDNAAEDWVGADS